MPGFFHDDDFGRCSLFPHIKDEKNSLVTGKRKMREKNEYFFCSTARRHRDMCGREGKFFDKGLFENFIEE
jgi:hypothetical protein